MERQPRRRKRKQNGEQPKETSGATDATATEPAASTTTVGTVNPDDLPLAKTRRQTSAVCLPSDISQSGSSSSTIRRSRSRSPARFYREREQSELQNLNDRLLSHVENVKSLQAENTDLKLQIKGMEVARLKTKALKQLHLTDKTTLQELLDTARQENSYLEQSLEAITLEMNNVKDSLAEEQGVVTDQQHRLQEIPILSQKCLELQKELTSVQASMMEKEDDVKRLGDHLVKEKLANKRLEDEAHINKSRYIKDIGEASARMSQHMETTDQKLEAGYEDMVKNTLAGLREQNVHDLEALREELTTVYQSKLTGWKDRAERANADLLATKKELKASKAEQTQLRSQTTQLKMAAAACKVQLEEEQMKYHSLRNESERDLCQLQRETTLLKQELSETKEELEEMGGANMRLENEIASYRVILDDLESKSPFKSQAKLKRHQGENTKSSPTCLSMPENVDTTEEMQATDTNEGTTYIRSNEVSHGVLLDDICSDGRYISLVNKTDHLVDMCLWTVKQSSPNDPKIVFEIPFNTPLDIGQRLVIWSQGEGPFVDGNVQEEILSLPDDLATRDYYNLHTNSNTRHTMNALHITMQGSQWLEGPSFMNLRLEDGDRQLQTKSDFISLSRDGVVGSTLAQRGWGSRSNLVQGLSKLIPFYAGVVSKSEQSISMDAMERGCDSDTRNVQQRFMKACESSKELVDEQTVNKDACVTM